MIQKLVLSLAKFNLYAENNMLHEQAFTIERLEIVAIPQFL